jgi:hypothetical protein
VGTAIELVAVFVAPTALGYAVLAGMRGWRAAAERRHAAQWRREHPSAPPIERLAADLRRLRSALDDTDGQIARPGKAVRVRALRGAYLDALGTACAELDVSPPQCAGRAQPSWTEIYRVEAALRSRGLDVRAAA